MSLGDQGDYSFTIMTIGIALIHIYLAHNFYSTCFGSFWYTTLYHYVVYKGLL